MVENKILCSIVIPSMIIKINNIVEDGRRLANPLCQPNNILIQSKSDSSSISSIFFIRNRIGLYIVLILPKWSRNIYKSSPLDYVQTLTGNISCLCLSRKENIQIVSSAMVVPAQGRFNLQAKILTLYRQFCDHLLKFYSKKWIKEKMEARKAERIEWKNNEGH